MLLRDLLGPGLGLRFVGELHSEESSNLPSWGDRGDVAPTIRVSMSSRSSFLLTQFTDRDDLVRLGAGVPGTSNTIALKNNSDSVRGDVKVGGLAGSTDLSTNMAFSFNRT